MRNNSLLRRAILPLALVIGVFSITASAQAWTLHEVNYGPASLQPSGKPGSLLQVFGGFEVTGNIAIYEGAGTVGICQSTWDNNAGVYREGCGNNAVGNALNLTPYYGHALWPGVRNNSGFVHTFRGVYYYGTP